MKKPILATLAMALMCGLLTTNAQAGGPGSRGREIERHARKTVDCHPPKKMPKKIQADRKELEKQFRRALKKWKL